MTCRQGGPSVFSLFGREWHLLNGVFAPTLCYSTQLFADWLPYPHGGSLLEIGSGTGVIAVTGALRGCARVAAVDISPAAVRNTRLNAERHGVGNRVRVVRSDLFSALRRADRFDVIFWNSNFIEPPPGFVPESELDNAIFDSGYATHRRFLRSGPGYLAPGGRLLLGFSTLGSAGLLAKLAAECRLRIENLRSSEKPLAGIRYQLLELVPEG
jgi:release factor glutamine methyltransferase